LESDSFTSVYGEVLDRETAIVQFGDVNGYDDGVLSLDCDVSLAMTLVLGQAGAWFVVKIRNSVDDEALMRGVWVGLFHKGGYSNTILVGFDGARRPENQEGDPHEGRIERNVSMASIATSLGQYLGHY
jgi:hypothetical protein